ncbi:peptidase M19 [Azospirillum sp. RWY-5-1]|uniref:Peptidase M19 n=1 Tax=Azospirillum oleiclasticum TaxID=2735135 RepID=A0ABX2TAN9_9PROT|nr:membrane dipeptidase [Azospirillum oleiclasticum]NYZ12585.1 peptidase M19 [Azospirillum oleiclasticum]NYZ19745.1 peptidase M19 [Azospirillum oleiclasticum]
MHITWSDLVSGAADALDGVRVEVTGWMVPVDDREEHGCFLLAPEPPCCAACPPTDPLTTIAVFASHPIGHPGAELRVAGQWRRVTDDAAGWLFQLRDAVPIPAEAAPPTAFAFTRRGMLAAGAAIGLSAFGSGRAYGAAGEDSRSAARRILADTLTVDLHSHAGRVLPGRDASRPRPFEALAEPMRDGGLSVACLAIVADSPTTEITPERRIRAVRQPEPGELHAWGRAALDRLHRLIAEQRLAVVTDAATLRAARTAGPAVVVAAEGADFLEGVADRLDEAHAGYRLRHLQLTHYRVNELGDIQTETPVHGGLTAFGAEVVRRCNRLGIVVDVAHGTTDLVKRAAAVTTKPLVLSHTSLAVTSLSGRPPRRSRRITADHARIVAGTGGVVGVWPPTSEFPDLTAYAGGVARMADAVGVDHVGIGSDMMGLLSPSALPSYRRLPHLAASLLEVGFRPDEIGRILGGNYARVFAASVG